MTNFAGISPPICFSIAVTWGSVGIGLLGLIVALGLFVAALPWVVQPFLKCVLFFRYRFKRVGLENIPKSGPVLLVSNHVTWFDGFFLAASLPRPGTALVNADVFGMPVLGYMARRCGLIPVPYRGPKAQRAAIETCRKSLEVGRALGIFPEGQLTRNGMTGPFHRGLEVILGRRTDVAVIPVYIDNGWGSLMSHSDGKFVWKRPQGWRRTVVIAFGPPIPAPVTAFTARQAVLVMGVKARSTLGFEPKRPEPILASLPHFEHPELGPLTGSAVDIDEPKYAVHQVGQKPGTIGEALPGIAIRAVDESGGVLLADAEGRLQALVPGRTGWEEIGHRGKVDKDGFITLAD